MDTLWSPNLAQTSCQTWTAKSSPCGLLLENPRFSTLTPLRFVHCSPPRETPVSRPLPVRIQVWTRSLRSLAARLGFEPRYSPPEGEVLPLDDLAIYRALAGVSSHHATGYELAQLRASFINFAKCFCSFSTLGAMIIWQYGARVFFA